MSKAPAGLDKDEVWKILVETVQALPMYKNHKHYVENVMIKEKPAISPQELAVQLNIPLGEALVILEDLRISRSTKGETAAFAKPSDHTLLDFSR